MISVEMIWNIISFINTRYTTFDPFNPLACLIFNQPSTFDPLLITYSQIDVFPYKSVEFSISSLNYRDWH